jgi:tRNA threonylcarbamoyladenosine biosynthesis protein TsaE
VLELSSDLGGGKTAFVKGLADGAGSTDIVASPTFTVSRVYKAPRFTIGHYDFYRLDEAGLMANEIAEAMTGSDTVTVIEWAGIAENVLPKNRITLKITPTGDNSRLLLFTYDPSFAYLFEGR